MCAFVYFSNKEKQHFITLDFVKVVIEENVKNDTVGAFNAAVQFFVLLPLAWLLGHQGAV